MPPGRGPSATAGGSDPRRAASLPSRRVDGVGLGLGLARDARVAPLRRGAAVHDARGRPGRRPRGEEARRRRAAIAESRRVHSRKPVSEETEKHNRRRGGDDDARAWGSMAPRSCGAPKRCSSRCRTARRPSAMRMLDAPTLRPLGGRGRARTSPSHETARQPMRDEVRELRAERDAAKKARGRGRSSRRTRSRTRPARARARARQGGAGRARPRARAPTPSAGPRGAEASARAAIARAEAAEARVASWAGERAPSCGARTAELREKLGRYMAYANTEARRLQRDAQVADELVAFGRPSAASEHIRPWSEPPPPPPEFVVRRAEPRDSTLLMPTRAGRVAGRRSTRPSGSAV